MSSIATSGVVPSETVGNIAEGTNSTLVQKPHKNIQDYESDSESDTSTDIEDDSSDDDKRLADNPILKERLKQLDRYATPIKHHTHSPVQIIDQHSIPGIYATNVPPDNTPNNGSLSIHGKSSGPSELMDSSLTPPEYRSRQFSAAESPTPCSSSASLSTSITSKHNLSPPNTILGTSTNVSGPILQHEIPDVSVYAHSSNSLSCKSSEIPSTYTYGPSLNSSSLIHSTDVCYNEVGDNQACVCEVCHVVYANRSSLRSHMKKHLNQSIKRHQCDQCPYSTQYGKNLFKHIESMHTVDSCQEFRCEGCTRSFTNEDLLRDHDCIVTQYNTYRCSECGRVFKTKLRLKYHADVHNPRKPYVCDIDGCDRAFRTPKYLKNHRDEFHRMHPKNYACPVGQCDLIFHRKTHLKRHIATHDDSEKKYQCQWPNCQRRFCTEETLNLHHSKHTGEKPFNCSLCLYNCYDKPSLNEHYQVNHAKDANFAYNFKDLIHRIPSTTTHSSQHLSETHGYRGSCGEGDTRAFVARTSTPVSTVRHRMADILDSCTPDIPGPLDAEINGILDSLDKESDLPDLFGNGTLEMNRSGAEQNFTNNTNLNSIIQASPYRQNSQSSCLAATLPPSSSVNSVNAESGTSESSLTSLLPNILSELQRAELSGSNEEFEKVKSHVLSVLPTFVIGDKLSTQINEIVDEVNDALLDQPLHVIRAAFYTTRPFNREELYMIDLLEQQMLSESSLTAPNPPRRRGRRPKLQQQLQPYLQRIFSLESGAAESMASQLVNASQKEKYINHYGYYNRSTGFGRGRGRGKSGKHPLSNVKPPSDGLMSKNNPYSQSVYHNSEGLNMCSNGVVKRGRTDSCTQGEYCIEQISDDMPSSNFPNDINSAEQYHTRPGVMHALNHPNDLRTTHTSMFLNSCNYSSARFHCPSEMNRLDMSRISRNSNDDELNESEDGTPTIITTNNYNSNNMTHQFMYNQSRTLTDHEDHKGRDYDMQNDTQNNHNNSNRKNSSHNEKDFMNQDTIGEMLEDLGVIVQKIGERAVARKHQHHAEGQPLNLSDFGGGGRQPCDSMNNRQFFNRNEANSHSIQLPSMATLASGGSVDTPPSVEENSSIPGSVSNPETPHLSTASYHALSSLKSFNAYSQIGISLADGTKNTVPGSTSASISNTSQAGYNSLTNNYHRTAPIWSCESMCFSSTRGDELRKSDQTHITNNNFNPQTRNSQSTRDYSNKPNGDMNQSYYPKDLSTRVQSFGSRSDSTIHQSQHSPKDFTRSESNDPNFNDIISGSLMNHHPAHLPPKDSSGSQISTAEAVDHLRSLSALGAKYTACLEMQEESRYQSNQRLFPEDYAYNQSQIHSSDASLRRNPTEQGGGESLFSSQMSHNSGRIPTSNILGYNMPSALNNLLYSGQKPNEYAVSLSRLTGNGSSRDNPMNADITTTMAAPTNCASGSSNSSSSSSNTTHNDADSSSAVRSSGFGNHNSDAFGTLRNYSSAASVAAAYHQQLSSPRCAINNNNSNSNNSMNRSDLSGHNSYASNPTPSSSGSSSSSSASGSLTHSSSTASSSSPPLSVRSSLQELYQHHHHQQQQQQSTVRPPIQEVTTRQLLSEAAATAVYAHGLGRCDGQGFNGLPVIPSGQQGDNTDALQRSNNQYTGFPFSSNQYRYQSFDNNQYTTTQSSVSVSNNRLVSEQQLSHNNNSSTTEYSSNSNYVEHNPDGRSTTTPTTIANTNTSLRDNYSLYPSHHLRQGSAAMQNTLGNSRSMVEHAQANNTATASQQLAHSIHEVSGLAAAYAYHQYHHQQQQQHQQAQVTPTNRQHQLPQPQAIPQPPPPPSAHTHYQNLLGQTNRPYNTTGTGQLDEENLSSHQHSRELTVPHHNNNNNTHPVHSSERHDPKSAYLAETYRNAQHITTTPGRFFF